ncbi:MAG: WxcM-like domain-containing protein [Candidatus Gracilibacteria bacterium]|nr:WxcM-like domain-containing protein [Candidatus Gracilibacteria bacterium]
MKKKLIKLFDTNSYFDNRGGLIELKSDLIRKNMKHFFISYTLPGSIIPRGNHYHTKKNEWFYIIKGKMKAKVESLDGKIKEEQEFDENLKKFIYISPKTVHTFWNIGNTELILLAIIDRKFLQYNTDTFFKEISYE